MSLKKILLKSKITYKLYVYYNLYIRHKAHKKRKFYSQWGEDHYIQDFFKGKKKGFYVDIGSFHPILYSNTCCLYNKGWNGINIDINHTTIDLFNIIRPNDYNICAAISDKIEEVDIFFDDHFSPVNTLKKSFYDVSDKNVAFRNLKKKKIITKKFVDIVKDIKNLPNIDFLNIDCEGYDFEVLNGFDLNFYKPNLICIETHDVNGKENESCQNIFNLIKNFNYVFFKRCGPSSIFKKNV